MLGNNFSNHQGFGSCDCLPEALKPPSLLAPPLPAVGYGPLRDSVAI